MQREHTSLSLMPMRRRQLPCRAINGRRAIRRRRPRMPQHSRLRGRRHHLLLRVSPNEAASPLEPPQAPQAHAAHDTHLAPNSLEPPACCITPAHADSVSLKTPETLPMGDEELQLVSRLRSSAKPQWPDLGALLLDFNRLPTASSMPSVPHNIIDAVVASPGVTESAHRASPPSDQSACIPPSTAAAPNMTPAPAETDSVGSSSAFALSAASLAAIERAVPPSQPQAKPPTLGPAALEAPRRAVGDHPHAPTTPAAVQLLPCEAQQSLTSKPGPHLSQTGPPSAENVANMIAKVRSLVRGASDEQITSALERTSHNLSRAVELVKAAVASAAGESGCEAACQGSDDCHYEGGRHRT